MPHALLRAALLAALREAAAINNVEAVQELSRLLEKTKPRAHEGNGTTSGVAQERDDD